LKEKKYKNFVFFFFLCIIIFITIFFIKKYGILAVKLKNEEWMDLVVFSTYVTAQSNENILDTFC